MHFFGVEFDMVGLVALFAVAITAIAALQGAIFDGYFDRYNATFGFGQGDDWSDWSSDRD
jgi:hypothetical protein